MGFIDRWNLTSLWFVAFIVLLTNTANGAVECRKNTEVQSSIKNLDVNAAQGGHVWIHVFGTKNRNSYQKAKVGKSMFQDFAHFQTIWKAWINSKSTQAKKCVHSTLKKYHVDCVTVDKLGNVKKVYNDCMEVDKNRCIKKSRDLPMKSVAFVYDSHECCKKVRGAMTNTYTRWILYTAYPTGTTNCKRYKWK